MIYLLFTPFVGYFAMLLTVVIMYTVGYDVKGVETFTIWFIYIQIYVYLFVITKLLELDNGLTLNYFVRCMPIRYPSACFYTFVKSFA